MRAGFLPSFPVTLIVIAGSSIGYHPFLITSVGDLFYNSFLKCLATIAISSSHLLHLIYRALVQKVLFAPVELRCRHCEEVMIP